jgi:hypothetical protein
VLTLERDADGRAHGGRVRTRGPLGVRRTATTQVLAADPPQQLFGVAEVGRGTRAFVRWKLRGGEDGTRVRLEATIDRVGWIDRVLLVLGGRAWLEQRFSAVLGRLAETFPARVTAVESHDETSPHPDGDVLRAGRPPFPGT